MGTSVIPWYAGAWNLIDQDGYDLILECQRRQGLTLVHFSAQLKRFLWDRGCLQGCLGVV